MQTFQRLTIYNDILKLHYKFLNVANETQFINGGIENDRVINVETVETSDSDTEDFFRVLSDQLIHPNLECKTADAIIMILSFFLQHHLTWVALEDLLTLFHNILGDDSKPKTKYFFKNCFGLNQRTVIHFYLKKCMVYLDTYENLKTLQDNNNNNNKQHHLAKT